MLATPQCGWLYRMALTILCLAGLWMQVMSQNDQCGEEIIRLEASRPSRALESPGYPEDASPGLQCRWTVTAPAGRRIVLTVRDLRVHDNRESISSVAAELNESLGETFRLDRSVNVHQLVSAEQVVNVDWSGQSLMTGPSRRFRLDLSLLAEGASMQADCINQTGLFLCESRSVCVKTSGVCDSFVDCPDKSDESNCFPACPRNCSCSFENDTIVNCTANPDLAAVWSSLPLDTKKLILRKNNITKVNPEILAAVPNAVQIDLQRNLLTRLNAGDLDGENKLQKITLNLNRLSNIEDGVFRSMTSLSILRLDENNLSELREGMFEGLGNLTILRLGRNSITTLRANTFRHLKNLLQLDLGSNPIAVIEPNAFNGLSRLGSLEMQHTSLTVLHADAFAHLTSLVILDIRNNLLTTIEPGSFNGLENLLILAINRDPGVKVKLKVNIRELNHLTKLTSLFVDDSSLCCLVDYKSEDGQRCYMGPGNVIVIPYYTCDRLMHNPFLRVSNWCLGISALIGNVFIIFWRLRTKDSGKRSQSFLILNLAVSDLIMGVYMLIIAGADVHFRDEFYIYAGEWRTGALCKFAGFLSMLSSEASVFFITMISIDRFLCVVFPFGKKWLRLESARVASLALWVVALSISAPPPLLQNKLDDFYGMKDVCVGLPFKQSGRSNMTLSPFQRIVGDNETLAVTVSSSPSYKFSIAVYLGVNLVCCLVVLGCYAAIAFVVLVKLPAKKLQKRKDKDHRRKEIVMARRMLLIVGTDLCCWMPVILMVILSISDTVSISNYVHAWVVVFIIPINSAINPYLYTFSNAQGSPLDCCPRRARGSSQDAVKMQPVPSRDKDTITQRCRSSTNTLL